MAKKKVYDAFAGSDYIATGTAGDVSAALSLSKGYVRSIISNGHERYTLCEVGLALPVFALYEDDIYITSGSVAQLAEYTGMTVEAMEWRRSKTAQSRNFKFYIYELEDEVMVTRNVRKFNFVENVLELKFCDEIYTGTANEIMVESGASRYYIERDAVLIGKRHAILRATHRQTKAMALVTLDELVETYGLNRNTAISAIYNAEGVTKNYILEVTGRHNVEYLQNEQKGTEKPVSEYVSVKPVYAKKRVTMEKYWSDMFSAMFKKWS